MNDEFHNKDDTCPLIIHVINNFKTYTSNGEKYRYNHQLKNKNSD
jgi:hypothetical protein